MESDFRGRMETAAFAFRGYNVTNLGKSPQLLEHRAYGPMVATVLREASEICGDAISSKVDLVARVRDRRESSLATFAEDVALIVGMEMAQLELLEKFFGVPIRRARLTFGYSIGELAALLLGEVFEMHQVLSVPISLATECAQLAEHCVMGIVFTRGPILELDDVRRLCVRISSEGKGLIAPSSVLAPNTILVLAEGDTLERFREQMGTYLPEKTMLRRNPDKWPPLHTPLLWQRNISDRSAVSLFKIDGGFTRPSPPIISCVTGHASYNDFNSREHLIRWVDEPQLLWNAIYETLAAGVETVIHVGPDPNLIPATFERLATNVSSQIGSRFLRPLGRRMISRLAKRSWLSNLLPSQTALLRAPFVDQIILEDWLLDQEVP